MDGVESRRVAIITLCVVFAPKGVGIGCSMYDSMNGVSNKVVKNCACMNGFIELHSESLVMFS